MALVTRKILTFEDLPENIKHRIFQIVELNNHLMSQDLTPPVSFNGADDPSISVHDPFYDESGRDPVDPVLYYGQAFLDSAFCQPDLGPARLEVVPVEGPLPRILNPKVYDTLLLRAINGYVLESHALTLDQLHELLWALGNEPDLRAKVLDAIEHYQGLAM